MKSKIRSLFVIGSIAVLGALSAPTNSHGMYYQDDEFDRFYREQIHDVYNADGVRVMVWVDIDCDTPGNDCLEIIVTPD